MKLNFIIIFSFMSFLGFSQDKDDLIQSHNLIVSGEDAGASCPALESDIKELATVSENSKLKNNNCEFAAVDDDNAFKDILNVGSSLLFKEQEPPKSHKDLMSGELIFGTQSACEKCNALIKTKYRAASNISKQKLAGLKLRGATNAFKYKKIEKLNFKPGTKGIANEKTKFQKNQIYNKEQISLREDYDTALASMEKKIVDKNNELYKTGFFEKLKKNFAISKASFKFIRSSQLQGQFSESCQEIFSEHLGRIEQDQCSVNIKKSLETAPYNIKGLDDLGSEEVSAKVFSLLNNMTKEDENKKYYALLKSIDKKIKKSKITVAKFCQDYRENASNDFFSSEERAVLGTTYLSLSSWSICAKAKDKDKKTSLKKFYKDLKHEEKDLLTLKAKAKCTEWVEEFETQLCVEPATEVNCEMFKENGSFYEVVKENSFTSRDLLKVIACKYKNEFRECLYDPETAYVPSNGVILTPDGGVSSKNYSQGSWGSSSLRAESPRQSVLGAVSPSVSDSTSSTTSDFSDSTGSSGLSQTGINPPVYNNFNKATSDNSDSEVVNSKEESPAQVAEKFIAKNPQDTELQKLRDEIKRLKLDKKFQEKYNKLVQEKNSLAQQVKAKEESFGRSPASANLADSSTLPGSGKLKPSRFTRKAGFGSTEQKSLNTVPNVNESFGKQVNRFEKTSNSFSSLGPQANQANNFNRLPSQVSAVLNGKTKDVNQNFSAFIRSSAFANGEGDYKIKITQKNGKKYVLIMHNKVKDPLKEIAYEDLDKDIQKLVDAKGILIKSIEEKNEQLQKTGRKIASVEKGLKDDRDIKLLRMSLLKTLSDEALKSGDLDQYRSYQKKLKSF